MAYYVIDQTTNELIFVSEFEPPNHFVTNGHHVHNSPISASELNTRYEWDRDQSTFILRPTRLSKREFIRKFTVQEFATIRQAAAVNPTLDYFWQLFMLAEFIDLADADTINGVRMLEQAGLIATGRSTEILNG